MDEQKTAATQPGDAKRPQSWRSGARRRRQDVSAAQERSGVAAAARGRPRDSSRGLGVTATTLTPYAQSEISNRFAHHASCHMEQQDARNRHRPRS